MIPKVVRAMNNMQASYDENANKVVKLATHEKAVGEILNFLIDLPTIAFMM